MIFQDSASAQEVYWVTLKDKQGSSLVAHDYFSPESIERRILHKVELIEFSDLPVVETYITKLKSIADSVYGVSRWLNTALISASNFQIELISNLEFVENIILAKNDKTILSSTSNGKSDNFERTRKSQLEQLGYKHLKSLGLSGKGVSIAENLIRVLENISPKPLPYSFDGRVLKVRIPEADQNEQAVLLYFHQANENGFIIEYKVIKILPGEVFEIELASIDKTETIRLRSGEYYSQINLKQ